MKIANRHLFISLTLAVALAMMACGTDFSTETNNDTTPSNNTTPTTTPTTTAPTATAPTDPLTASPSGKVTVKLSYSGKRTLGDVSVVLLPSTVSSATCETLDLNALPQAALAKNVTALPDSPTFDKLPVGVSYRVLAVSRNIKGFAVAAACSPSLVSPLQGYVHTVPLQLTDIAPSFSGTYGVKYATHLGSAIPEAVELKLADLMDTLQNLAPQLAIWMCGTEPVATNCKQSIIVTFLTEVSKVWVDEISKGSDATTRTSVGTDTLRGVLNSLVFNGRLTISGKPDTNGEYTATDNRLWLHSATYLWDLGNQCSGDADCPRQTMTGTSIGLDIAPVYVSATVSGLDQLQLSQTKFGFEMGRLLNQIVERHVLGAMFGNSQITSYERLLLRTLGTEGCLESNNCCDAFVTKIAQVIKDTSGAAAFCKTLSETAAAALRNKLISANAYGPNVLTLGSFAAPSCALGDSDENQTVDQIGSEDAPCLVISTISDTGASLPLLTTLSATRD